MSLFPLGYSERMSILSRMVILSLSIVTYLDLTKISDLIFIGFFNILLESYQMVVTTSVRAPWRFSYHIYYIVSYSHRLFLFGSYGIFLSLRCTISHLQTMSVYDLFLFVSDTSFSTMYSVSYSSVSALYYFPFLVDPTLTTFPTIIDNVQYQVKLLHLK